MPRYALLALLPTCLTASCVAPTDAPEDEDSGARDTNLTAEPMTALWMGQEIPPGSDDIALRDLLLPGTFNSTSYACDAANGISPDATEATRILWESLDPDLGSDGLNRQRIVDWAKAQDRSLSEQLLDGIRALDVNFTMKDGVLTTWHSLYGEPLDNALDQIAGFAANHPTEIVLLSFGPSLDAADLPAFVDALAAPRADGISICDLLFTGPAPSATATLAEVRASRRNLIWGPTGDLATLFDSRGDCPTAPFLKDFQGSGSITTDGVVAKLEATVATRVPDMFLANDFFFYLATAGSDLEQAAILLKYASLAEALDGLGFSGDFPGELIGRFDDEAQMNVFSGGYYERTNLVEAVIERTRTR